MNKKASSVNDLSPQQKRELLAKLLKVKAAKSNHAKGIAPTIQPMVRETGNLPLSFSQQRLWLLDQLEPGNTAYNISIALRLKGTLNEEVLRASLAEIIRRHEALRTTFVLIGEQPVQVINPPSSPNLPKIVLQSSLEPERDAELQRLISKEAMRPFDLVNGPLLRTTLLSLDETEHVFLFTFHHIVSDGWSVFVFIHELQILYDAFLNEQPSPLPKLSIQYVDFAQWQRQWLQGEIIESQLNYWKKQLAAPIPVLNLPLDYSRPKIQTFSGGKHALALSQPLTQKLKDMSCGEHCTLFMTLIAAYSALLYRQTGQANMVIGSPIAGRGRAELENLIGFFLNSLALRINLDGNPSFRELLQRVRDVALQAYANQDVPFEKLLEEIHPGRDLSRTPIFQVFFNMLNFNADTVFELPGMTGEIIYQLDTEARFDLTLYVREQDKQILLGLVYNSDMFSRERMGETIKQLEWLLMQIVDAPDKSIDAYSLLTPSARQILPDPTISIPEPEQVLVHQMIKAWARQTPNEPAIMQDDQHWTYAELDEYASKLARRLIQKGLKPGDVVAVCGPRSFHLIASMVAAFLSGGVLLSIDHNLPDQRKQLMLHESKTRALIYLGDEQQRDLTWADGISPENILFLDRLSFDALMEDEINDPSSISFPQISGNEPAYVFFTSGTTGVPKGVLGNHKGLSHFLSWQRDTFGIKPQDRAAQLTALSFDVVLRDIFVALVSGATLCLPKDDILLDPEETLNWLQQTHISIVHTVPTLAQTWLGNIPVSVSLPDLRWLFFAGEPLKDTLVQRWRASFPHGQIINLYGPTETTMAKCFYQVPENPPPGVQPVGFPMPQTQALVINKNGQLCGIGEPGEIVLRTPFRTLGYINGPEENLKKFFKNPFQDVEQDVVYYTGDQGRYRPDGQLDILGRIDDQIKIRGIRIELGEIESALTQHPEVQQAAVSVWEAGSDDKRLVAYIVYQPPHSPQINELRVFLKQQLPDYLIPASIIALDKIPLTSNGKLDRKALPRPDFDTKLDTSFIPPHSETEKTLATIWGDVLKVKQVGIHDNFFELGGHSILATQVVSRIRKNFQFNLSIRDFFAAPTVAQLAKAIDTIAWATQSQSDNSHVTFEEGEEIEL